GPRRRTVWITHLIGSNPYFSYSASISVPYSIACRSSVTQRHKGVTSSFFDTCPVHLWPRDGLYDVKTRDFLFGAALAIRRSAMKRKSTISQSEPVHLAAKARLRRSSGFTGAPTGPQENSI